MDIKIYLHKWYPWSYNYKGEPAVVLQGFYSLKAARKGFNLLWPRESKISTLDKGENSFREEVCYRSISTNWWEKKEADI